MLSSEEYILKSVEYNLFWTRIMKEHAVFIESSIPASRKQLAAQADQFKQRYDRLLLEVIRLADGVLPAETLQSGQFYTKFTETAEQAVQKFTGIEINRNTTRLEYNIKPSGQGTGFSAQLKQHVSSLNQRILTQTKTFSRFKSDLLNSQSSCELFTYLYPADLSHILREALRYEEILTGLQGGTDREYQNDMEFWNQNMSDHAKTMRGLFDPTEVNYFNTANSYAMIYDNLSASGPDRDVSLEYTIRLSAFKADSTQSLIECRLKAIMSALFTDHLLREANHYIYLLRRQ